MPLEGMAGMDDVDAEADGPPPEQPVKRSRLVLPPPASDALPPPRGPVGAALPPPFGEDDA